MAYRLNQWVTEKKLSKANSVMIQDTIFYIAKMNFNQKVSSLYNAYDQKSGIAVYWHEDKEKLIDWLRENIDRIEQELEVVYKSGAQE